MEETLVKKTHNEVRIVVDPHDRACHGAHNIVVWVQVAGWNEVHVSYGWQASAFLSPQGTREFSEALAYALRRGDEIAETLRTEQRT